MMFWKYSGKDFNPSSTSDIEDFVGFIYEVEFSNGKKYLGRKAFFHNRKLPPLKGYKRKRKVVVESDWRKYIGSSKNEDLNESLKNGEITVVSKSILKFCESLWEMTYYETKHLFERDCILDENYYNNNILGKFYRPSQ